jgi:hypothetical protein
MYNARVDVDVDVDVDADADNILWNEHKCAACFI